MVDFIHWPASLLTPLSSPFDPRPFSRMSPRSLGGVGRSTRTDRGFWTGSYNSIIFRRGPQFAQRRVWNAIRTALGGMPGLIVVPVCASHVWAAEGFKDFASVITTHDDDTTFDDDTGYSQGVIDIQMASYAPLGATIVTLRLVNAPTASGIRFSYQHAMYETGRILAQTSEDTFQVEVFPAIRMPIPAAAQLNADRPTVLCHLASDTEMDIEFPAANMPRPSVSFVEAVDYWNSLAIGEVA